MKNRIIMTVGTSLLSSACWNFPGIRPLSRAINDTERRKNELENYKILCSKSEQDLIKVNAFLDNCWEQIALVRSLPAEMATLRFLMVLINSDTDQSNHLKQKDELFLIHSDNNDGRKCAEVQKTILTKFLPEVSIEREPIANLDPADKSQLEVALKKIMVKCEDWLQPKESMNVYLNLTGGYKATTMVITSVATRLNRPATIVYGHESSDLAREGLYTIEFGGPMEGDVNFDRPRIKLGHVGNSGVIHSIIC